jgi:4-amino-4-deoxy-L-arabinose transferase-like glycosyltransferase
VNAVRSNLYIASLIAVLTAALYLPRLGRAPIYLGNDEVIFGLHAQAIADTGRDLYGNVPLFVEYRYETTNENGVARAPSGWLPAMVCWAIALVLKVLPLSETAIRLPTVVAGVVDVVLMYFIGMRIFRNRALAVLGAGLLALTPAHFIHSRFALDLIFPVPFLLAWLLFLTAYLEDGRERQLFAAMLFLGLGLFTYIASAVTTPLCFLLTVAALAWSRRPVRAYGVAMLGLAVPLALFVAWMAMHPSALGDTLRKYDVPAAGGMNPVQQIRALFTLRNLADRLSRWWIFFDPRFLFVDGPMEPMFSTRAIGVFVLPIALLLPLGVRAALRGALTSTALLLLGGLIVTPVPLTLTVVPDAIARVLGFLPFVVLLSVGGVAYLWSMTWSAPPRRLLQRTGVGVLMAATAYTIGMLVMRSRLPGTAMPMFAVGALALAIGALPSRVRIGQVLVPALLAFVPFQFGRFYLDYLTDYQSRVSQALAGNYRGAFEDVIAQDRAAAAPAVYLIGLGAKGDRYYTFYLAKHHREDLRSRTVQVGPFDSDQVLTWPSGSLIVTPAGYAHTDAAVEDLVRTGQVSRTIIREPSGVPTFVVLRRPPRS